MMSEEEADRGTPIAIRPTVWTTQIGAIDSSSSLGLQLQLTSSSATTMAPIPAESGKEESSSWEQQLPSSDISRTPSQSTTGTNKSHNSLETAASSLRSGSASTESKNDAEMLRLNEKTLPALPTAHSPGHFVTACSSPEEVHKEQRETDALRRYHALHELVETEKGYAEDLHILDTIFFANLSNQAYFEENAERVETVKRNAGRLYALHSRLASAWEGILDEQKISVHDEEALPNKAARCGEAIRQIVECLTRFVSLFGEYRLFCSRHAEALVIIREAERRHNGDDFAAFERMCANLIRSRVRTSISTRYTNSRPQSGTITPLQSLSPLTSPLPSEEPSWNYSSAPSSGSSTPSGTFVSLSNRSSSKLVFADYMIKPIQRLCLYPLVLNSLLKYTPAHEMDTQAALRKAIEAMRTVADEVDQASRIREKDLMAALTLSRIGPTPSLPYVFLKSLGPPQLSGTLDVLHHHDVEEPLTPPLRFQHLGVILWTTFVLFVRIRKNQQLECRHWFSLVDASVSPLSNDATETEGAQMSEHVTLADVKLAGRPMLPFAFRLTFNGAHHFELSASHEREFKMWHDALRLACEESHAEAVNMSALPTQPASLSSLAGTLSGSTAMEEYIGANMKQPLASSLDNLIKLPSVSTRNAVDRNMIFSDVLVAPVGIAGMPTTMVGGASALKEISEALIAQQLRQSGTPSIGSAVGAAMGLAKMAATQMPTVKRVRKMSSLTPLDTMTAKAVGLALSEPSEDGTVAAAQSGTTSKRNSFSTLRANSHHGESAQSSRVTSPTVESFGARVKVSLLRANSRLGRSSSSRAGSLPASPTESHVDLTQTASPSSGRESENDTIRPSYARAKSNAIRNAWTSTVVARRTRSQSAQSSFTMGPRYEGVMMTQVQSPTTIDASSQSESDESPFGAAVEGNASYFADGHRPSHTTTSAPASGQNSRRQSVASILSDVAPQRRLSAQAGGVFRTSSPSLSMSQVREGAATKLKKAKSAARNRMSSYGGGASVTTAGSAAVPLASSTVAQGRMSVASSSDDTVHEQRARPTSSSSSLSSSTEGLAQSNHQRAESIAERLRGSLSRASSMRTLSAPRRDSYPDVRSTIFTTPSVVDRTTHANDQSSMERVTYDTHESMRMSPELLPTLVEIANSAEHSQDPDMTAGGIRH